MNVFTNSALAGASGQAAGGGYEIERSLRFNSGDSSYLNHTPSSAGNRRTFTFSFWAKLGDLAAQKNIITASSNPGASSSSSPRTEFRFTGNGGILFATNSTGSSWNSLSTTAVFRDPSAWYHVVVAVDTTQATASNRVKIYVNGVQELWSGSVAGQNDELPYNNTYGHAIGTYANNYNDFFDGYLAEFISIDGQALAATDFGGFDDNNLWQPKKFDGTYATAASGTLYSSYGTGTVYNAAHDWAQAFNGTISTTGATHTFPGNNQTLTWTPPSPITVNTSATFYVYNQTNGSSYGCKVNGSYLASSSAYGHAETKTAAELGGQISSIELVNSNLTGPYLTAVEVDGTVLTDGTFATGTNSFHLDFSDTSSNSALGTDSSPNGNNWTVNNLFASSGSVPTSPTNTYLDFVMGYYLNGSQPLFLCKDPAQQNVASSLAHGGASGTTWAVDDVLQWAVDQDNGKLWLGRNNTWYSGDPSTATDASMHNWGSGNLYLGKAYDSPDLKLEIAATAAYTPPTGYTYWSASSTGSWVGSGNSTSNTANDIFNTAIPATGKIYIEAKIKGGVGVYQTLGLMNVGETVFETDAFRDSPANGIPANDTGVGGELSGNYCTWNPLTIRNGGGTMQLVDGNLNFGDQGTASRYGCIIGTMAVASGKWYFEITYGSGTGVDGNVYAGILPVEQYQSNNSANAFNANYASLSLKGDSANRGDNTNTASYASGIAIGDTVGIAFDVDTGTSTWYLNGTSLGAFPYVLAPGYTWTPFANDWSNNQPVSEFIINCGQRPWVGTAPSGYKALCSANLPEPTIADGSTAFDAKTYTGTGNALDITGVNFSPDLVWIKNRSTAYSHCLYDTVRGVGKRLASEGSYTEDTYNLLTDFNDDGFSLGSGFVQNASGVTSVAWVWDGGSSNTTIAAGSLTSSMFNQSQRWRDNITSSNGWNTSYPVTNIFNGVFNGGGGAANNGGGGSITFTPPASIAVTSLELNCYSEVTLELPDGSTQTISGVGSNDQTVAANIGSGFTFTGSNSIVISRTSGFIYIDEIKINGKALVDDDITISAPTIASTVRANPSAGFSIVSYTGTTSAATVGHGLNGNAPKMIIVKDRDNSYNWQVAHIGIGKDESLILNGTNAATDYDAWNNTRPNSSVFSLGAGTLGVNTNGADLIAYCFAPVEGYSSFGSYLGSTAPNFIHTGFTPALVICKRTDASGEEWLMTTWDTQNYNPFGPYLLANSSGAEGTTSGYMDIVSNGFVHRHTAGYNNTNGGSYVYMAWASHPFKTSRAR